MILWLLSHLEGSPSTVMLQRAAAPLGAELIHVDPTRFNLDLGAPTAFASLFGYGDAPPRPDGILTRIGSSGRGLTHDVVRAVKGAGIPCVNDPEAIVRSTDKIRAHVLLAAAGLPVPRTILVGARGRLDGIEARLGPPPWVVKLPVSFQGLGIARADSMPSLRSIADLLRGRQEQFFVQEYVREAEGVDVRVLVLDGRAVVAMQRRSPPDDFRSNLHRGGQATAVPLTAEVARLAESAASALGLEIAGVDVLPSGRGPLVLEVNASPGLAGIQATTAEDLAARALETVIRRVTGGERVSDR